MKISTLTATCILLGLLSVGLMSGCQESGGAPVADAQLVTKHRSAFVMESEPDEIMGITELREKLEGTGGESVDGDAGQDHEGHDHDGAGHEGQPNEHGHEHAEGGGHDHDEGHDHGEGHDHDEAGDEAHSEHGHEHAEGDGHDHGDVASHDHESSEHVHTHADGTTCDDPDCEHDHSTESHVHADGTTCDDPDCEHDHSTENAHVHADGTTCDDPDCEHDHSTEHIVGLGSMDGITVVGKISKETTDGGATASDFPWESGQALFVMVDPSVEGGEPEHHHAEGEECPFCAKKKIEAQAVVQFKDGAETIAVDARSLFDLEVDDIVVVKGDAELLGGVLMISAEGIYVRK